jgi:hypothetical protein
MRSLLILTSLVAFTTGCPKAMVTTNSGLRLPDMVMNPTAGCGTGTFEVTTDVQMAMVQADANARSALAASIESTIRQVAEQAGEQLQAGGETNNLSSATLARRESIQQTLNGAAVSHREQVDGQLWSEVCINTEMFSEIVGDMGMSAQLMRETRERAADIIANMDASFEE